MGDESVYSILYLTFEGTADLISSNIHTLRVGDLALRLASVRSSHYHHTVISTFSAENHKKFNEKIITKEIEKNGTPVRSDGRQREILMTLL